MRNVVVVALGEERYAVELRWVREIFTLGPVTSIPTAPREVAGAVSFRGAILPLLHGCRLAAPGRDPARTPLPGDTALLLDVDDTRVALAVDRVDEVATLEPAPGGEGALVGRGGEAIPVLNARAVVRAASVLVAEAGADPRPPDVPR